MPLLPEPPLLAESALWLTIARRGNQRTPQWAAREDWFGYEQSEKTAGVVNLLAPLYAGRIQWWYHQNAIHTYQEMTPVFLVHWLASIEPYASVFAAGVHPFDRRSLRSYLSGCAPFWKSRQQEGWIHQWLAILTPYRTMPVSPASMRMLNALSPCSETLWEVLPHAQAQSRLL